MEKIVAANPVRRRAVVGSTIKHLLSYLDGKALRRIFATIALVIFGAFTANAQTTEPGYQQTGYTDCTTAGDCSISFPKTTAARTLIRHVSCDFALAASTPNPSILVAQVYRASDFAPNFLRPFLYGTASDGTTTYGINDDTYLFINQNDVPQVHVSVLNTPVRNLACTVSGQNR